MKEKFRLFLTGNDVILKLKLILRFFGKPKYLQHERGHRLIHRQTVSTHRRTSATHRTGPMLLTHFTEVLQTAFETVA